MLSVAFYPASPLNDSELNAIVAHCKIRTLHLSPRLHDAKIGELKRWFDLTEMNEAMHLLSPEIRLFLPKIHEAISNGTLELWILNLAALVQKILLDENHVLKEVFQQAIGLEKIQTIRTILRSMSQSPSAIEEALCQAYLFMIVQLIIKSRFHVTIETLKVVQDIYERISFVDKTQLTAKRKKALLNNILLDKENEEHLKYWHAQTNRDFLGSPGGKCISLRGKDYWVPTKVFHMMNISKDLTYEQFLAELERLRHFSSFFSTLLFSNPLSFITRKEETKLLYEHNSLETLKFKI